MGAKLRVWSDQALLTTFGYRIPLTNNIRPSYIITAVHYVIFIRGIERFRAVFNQARPTIAGGIIGVGGEVSWPRPTKPGDVLNVVSTIVNISPSKSKPDRGIVTIQSDTLNQHGELCQRLIAKVLVFRRS